MKHKNRQVSLLSMSDDQKMAITNLMSVDIKNRFGIYMMRVTFGLVR